MKRVENQIEDALDTTPPVSTKGKTLKSPSSRSGAATRSDANRAAGGKGRNHGQKKQLNTRVPEHMFADLMERVQRQAGRLEITQDSVQLWCLLHGLDALERGAKPSMSPAKTRNEVVF